MTNEILVAVPWLFQESPILSLWIWRTQHFEAKIQTDSHGNQFIWEISDLSQGTPHPLSDGLENGFRECEFAVREVIGKSYPAKLGYKKFAGALSTTFKIFTGERIDFGPMEATQIILTVRTLNKKTNQIVERTIAGKLKINNYVLEVSPDHGQTVRIPPTHILSVQREYGGHAEEKKENPFNNRLLRIYQGKVTIGCSGQPGMLPDTVEHPTRAPHCPIHEG